MKKVGIFGAGQAGVMVKSWLLSDLKFGFFMDNNEKRQGELLDGYPILSMQDGLKQEPDIIWIAVLNREARASIAQQLREAGFTGELISISEIREKMDIRLSAVRLIAEEIRKRKVPGEIAELGVFRGDLAKELNRLFPEKTLYLFDTFEGFSEKDLEIERRVGSARAAARDFSDTSVELVREKLPFPEKAVFCKGYFPESLSQLGGEGLPEFALVSLDPDLYEPVYQGLSLFYPRLSAGGAIVIHDYNSMQFPGVKKAVEKYCEEHDLFIVPLMDLHGTGILIKQGSGV